MGTEQNDGGYADVSVRARGEGLLAPGHKRRTIDTGRFLVMRGECPVSFFRERQRGRVRQSRCSLLGMLPDG